MSSRRGLRRETKNRNIWRLRVLMGGVALVAILGAVLVVLAARGNDETATRGADSSSAGTSMGGVEVVEPSADLGRRPLDVPVSHSFIVKNNNDRPVDLGVPAIEVLDGC